MLSVSSFLSLSMSLFCAVIFCHGIWYNIDKLVDFIVRKLINPRATPSGIYPLVCTKAWSFVDIYFFCKSHKVIGRSFFSLCRRSNITSGSQTSGSRNKKEEGRKDTEGGYHANNSSASGSRSNSPQKKKSSKDSSGVNSGRGGDKKRILDLSNLLNGTIFNNPFIFASVIKLDASSATSKASSPSSHGQPKLGRKVG